MKRVLTITLALVTLAAGALSVYALVEVRTLGVAMQTAHTRSARQHTQDQIKLWTTIGVAGMGVAIAGMLTLILAPPIVQLRRNLRELRRSDGSGVR